MKNKTDIAQGARAVDRLVLESWKEIAAYLGKSERTCQNWSKDLGLPVHRLDGMPRARVYAYTDELDRWLEEKLGVAEAGSASTPRRLVIPVTAFLAIAAVTGLLWRGLVHRRTAAPPAAKPVLAFLLFRNNSGDPALDIWRENIPTLLAAGLGQSRYLRVLDNFQVYGILKEIKLDGQAGYTAKELKNIADQGKATHLVTGSYFKAGGRFIVVTSLTDARTGATIEPIQAEAPAAEAIMDSVDSLVGEIKSALNVPEQAIEERDYRLVGDVYTRNPQALRYYIEGAKARESGEGENALRAFNRAVELDAGFAMAYRQLGIVHGNRFDFVNAYRYTRKAYELRGKIPEKDRLFVEGAWYLLKEETRPAAHAVFKKVVERYPEDYQGRYSFATTLEDWEESVRELKGLFYSQDQVGRSRLIYQLCQRCDWHEDYRQAREAFQDWANANRDDPWVHVFLGRNFELEKDLEAAGREYARAAALAPADPVIRSQTVKIDWLRGEPDRALKTLRDILPTAADASALEDWLPIFFLMKGRFDDALAIEDGLERSAVAGRWSVWDRADLLTTGAKTLLQAGKAEMALEKLLQGLESVGEIERQIPETGIENLMHLKRTLMIWEVCALCDLGRVEEAESVARQLGRLIPGYVKKRSRRCFCMDLAFPAGRIALAKEDGPGAVRILEKSLRELNGEDYVYRSDHAFLFDLLGDAYERLGRLDLAVEAYGRIRGLSQSLDWGAVYARSFYKRGRIYERMGEKGEALRELTRFLEVWKDADAGRPEVEDARARLSALR